MAPDRPTWIRVNRKYLLPETLEKYQLPWDWEDDDRNYILIKQWVDHDLQDELFEHTRRIREEKSQSSSFIPPRCEKTSKPLSFEVKLRTPVKLDDELQDDETWNNERATRIEDNPRFSHVSVSYARAFDDSQVVLYRRDSSSGAPQFSWYHTKRDPKNMEDFLQLASSAPGLDDGDQALLLRLFTKIKSSAKPSFAGRYLEPDVLRSDGRFQTAETTNQGKSATFLAFPYYSVKKIRRAYDSSYPSLYPTRSLLELVYSLDSTRRRDMEQAVCKTRQYKKEHAIHVPQLWAVIVNSRLVVTSCPIDMFEDIQSLKVIDIPAPPTPLSPSVIRVTDPSQRKFFIPMDRCKTWFALVENITEKCLKGYNLEDYDFQLRTSDNLVVHAFNWNTVAHNHGATFLKLSIRLLSIQRKLTAPKQPKKPELPLESDEKKKSPDTAEGRADEPKRPKLIGRVPTNPLGDSEDDSKLTDKHALIKYDPSSLPPNRLPRIPVPPSSGIVINTKNNKEDRKSNIYFVPRRAPDENTEIPQKDKSDETKNSDTRPRSPVSSRLKPSVPPVFTWATGGEKSSDQKRAEHTRSSATHPSDAPASEAEGRASKDSHHEEETLYNVCFQVHSNMLDLSKQDRTLYLDMLPSTAQNVAGLVKKSLRPSADPNTDYMSLPETAGALTMWQRRVQRTHDCLSSLFEFFVPMAYPCKVADAYWGALRVIFEHMPKIFGTSKIQNPSTESQEYYVVDLSGNFGQDLRNEKDPERLIRPFAECQACRNQRPYMSLSDAQDHLFTNHFPLAPEERHLVSPNWILRSHQYPDYVSHSDGHIILDLLLYHLEELGRLSREITFGVCANGVFDGESYRIPSASVEAFGYILMMVIYAASVVKSVLIARDEEDQLDAPVSFYQRDMADMVAKLGSQAENAMHETKRQVILMTTDDSTEIVSYEAVSPEFVLAIFLDEIHNRLEYRNSTSGVLAIYTDYISKLQFQINHRPRRRLLQPITHLSEELTILKDVAAQQKLIIENFRSVLRPSSFEVTTETRRAAFKLESNRIDKIMTGINHELNSVAELLNRAETLSTQTRSAVESREEDHGKAILVFTIVTVIFLPMSFVTSLFGMNTSDIRDMSKGQGIFWAVSIPLSTVVIALSLIIGFHGDRILEFLENITFGDGSGRRFDDTTDTSSDYVIEVEEELDDEDSSLDSRSSRDANENEADEAARPTTTKRPKTPLERMNRRAWIFT